MKQVLDKFIDCITNIDYEDIYFNYFNKELDNEDVLLSLSEDVRYRILREHFSYIEEYIDNEDFYQYVANNVDDEEVFLFIRFLLPSKLYNGVIKQLVNKDYTKIVISNEDDLNLLLNAGYSFEEIVQKCQLYGTKDFLLSLYNRDNSIAEKIINTDSSISSTICILEYLKGNQQLLRDKLSGYVYSSFVISFINVLSDYPEINIDEIIDMFTRDLDTEYKLNDKEYIKKLVSIFGYKALFFSNVIDNDIVDEIGIITLDDYTNIDILRDSPDLLLRMLNDGHLEFLGYAHGCAINDEVLSKMIELGFDDDYLRNNENLHSSFAVVKHFASKGDYSFYYYLKGILLDIEKFDAVMEAVDNGNYPYFNFKYEICSSYNKGVIPREVSKKIIDRGLLEDKEILFGYSRDINIDSLIEELIERGQNWCLLVSNIDNSLVEKYGDLVTYEEYLEVKDFIYSLPSKILIKLLKEKHYDVINEYTRISENIIEQLGLEDITYEEYLELPDDLKQARFFAHKFYREDFELFKKLIKNEVHSVDGDVVEYMRERDMTYEEFFSYIEDEFFAFSNDVVKYFLEKGNVEVFEHCKRLDKEVIIKYLDSLNGELPLANILRDSFNGIVVLEYYLSRGNKKILSLLPNDYIYFKVIDVVKKYCTLDDFVDNNICSDRLIIEYITKENESKIIELLKNHTVNGYFSSEILIKMFRNNYDIEYLREYIKDNNINISSLSSLLSSDEKKRLFDIVGNDLSINSQSFRDIKSVKKILKDIDPDLLKKNMSDYHVSDEVKKYIIRYMVSHGHYEFVNLYGNNHEVDVLKEALINGFFVGIDSYNMNYILKLLLTIKFSDEDINKFKEYIHNDDRYIFLIPEYLNNDEILLSYVLRNEELIKMIPFERKFDEHFLILILDSKPELINEFANNLSEMVIISLLNINTRILDYLNPKYITENVIKSVISTYPNVIDKVSYISDDVYKLAFDSGYELNINNTNAIRYALNNDIVIPFEKWLEFDFEKFVRFIKYLNIDKDKYKAYFEPVLDYYHNKDEVMFAFVISNDYYYNDSFREIIQKYDLSKYNYCDRSDYETFKLSYYLNNMVCDELSIPILEDLLENSKNKQRVFDKLLSFCQNKEKIHELAFKYLDYEPLFFVRYLDNTYSKVIEKVKTLLDKEPSLVAYVPEVFDNKEFILNFISSTKMDIFNILSDQFKNDLDIFKECLKINEFITFSFQPNNEDIINYARLEWKQYNSLALYIINELSKEDVLSIINYSNGILFNYISPELRADLDICKAYLNKDPYYLFNIPLDDPNYQEYVYTVLEINGSYIDRIDSKFIDNKAITIAIKTFPMALFKVDISLLNKENFEVLDFTNIDFSRIDSVYLRKILDNNLYIYINDSLAKEKYFCELLVKRVMLPNEEFSKEITLVYENLFNQNNSLLFKLILSNSSNFNFDYFSPDNALILKNAEEILNVNNKINTATNNPIFSYDVVKYIYPVFGLKVTLDLIKYNTQAASVLINEIKNGNNEFVQNIYDFALNNKLFGKKDDKFVHFVFRNLPCYRELMVDILSRGEKLSKKSISNLNKIIQNNNRYSINSVNDLLKYEEITNNYCKNLANSNDIITLKDGIARLFGYNDINAMKVEFTNFDMNNFIAINTVRDELINKYGMDKAKEMIKETSFTKSEVMVIKLMERIIKTNNLDELKELVNECIIKTNDAIDYCTEVDSIIYKKRLLYNMQYNCRLTNVDDIKSPKTELDGITIIDMDSEKFNFLAHRIYSYDFSIYKQMLLDDPSLWTRLDGASTLSTSSFSDKGFHVLEVGDPTGVIYLFNNLPKEFMLFMYGRDLYVEHGGHKLEPTSRDNTFTTIDGINQSSIYHHCSYNEVAGFREGMMPCAIACFSGTPNQETIRAAKYFGVPIIKFDVHNYMSQLSSKLNEAKKEYEDTLSCEALRNIVFSGISNSGVANDVKNIIDYCLDVMVQKQKDGSITPVEMYAKLNELERVVNQLSCTNESAKEQLSRVVLYRKTICALNGKSNDFECQLEVAHMGESGIMYKLHEKGKDYLVKPSVDKQHLEVQGFRGDIQGAASKLQSLISPDTAVNVDVIGVKNLKIAKQELLSIDKDKTRELEEWIINGGELDENLKDALLSEYVVDFLLCNFDCFVGNFVIDDTGNLRGIDKEQSFRFIDEPQSLNPSFNYIPNGNARIPIYKYLFERYNNGELNLDFSVVEETLARVELITDEEYARIFENYANDLNSSQKDIILQKILDRRRIAIEKIREYISSIDKNKVEGEVLS